MAVLLYVLDYELIKPAESLSVVMGAINDTGKARYPSYSYFDILTDVV